MRETSIFESSRYDVSPDTSLYERFFLKQTPKNISQTLISPADRLTNSIRIELLESTQEKS